LRERREKERQVHYGDPQREPCAGHVGLPPLVSI
jgi:hypothetical protein